MSKKELRVLEDIKEIRAFNDPYRQEILRQMFLLDKPSTSKEIAEAMNEPPSKVNYHLKVLESFNFVKIDHTKNINGIIAKFYVCEDNEFQIKLSKNRGNKVYENETLNMLAAMYDDSKNNYIKKLNKVMKDESVAEDTELGYLISTKMYLNEEEKKQLKDLIRKLSENKKEGREVFDFFISIF